MGEDRPSRVLLVEDNPEVLAFLRELLLLHGYEIEEAHNGVQAVLALTRPPAELPDVALLDIGLPLESGVSVLEFVRNALRSDLPVIVLTASANAEQEEELLKLGITRYLRKPASSEQVLSAISEALSPRRRGRGAR